MERSFKKEIEALKLGDGEIFRGEGILAVTKALLQSGVSYVGGYQGAPVSHLLDVLVEAEDIIGEDYGEGASVIQERSHAFAMKSSIWLLDPRPDLPTIVRLVEKGFELSEASHAPVMMELRIRACHVTGEFAAKDNRPGAYSGLNRLAGPPRFDYGKLSHPPVTFVQERLKVEERMPAAQKFIRDEKL